MIKTFFFESAADRELREKIKGQLSVVYRNHTKLVSLDSFTTRILPILSTEIQSAFIKEEDFLKGDIIDIVDDPTQYASCFYKDFSIKDRNEDIDPLVEDMIENEMLLLSRAYEHGLEDDLFDHAYQKLLDELISNSDSSESEISDSDIRQKAECLQDKYFSDIDALTSALREHIKKHHYFHFMFVDFFTSELEKQENILGKNGIDRLVDIGISQGKGGEILDFFRGFASMRDYYSMFNHIDLKPPPMRGGGDNSRKSRVTDGVGVWQPT